MNLKWKIFIITPLICIYSIQLFAQIDTYGTIESRVTKPSRKGVISDPPFYVVTNSKGQKSYLLGTMHIGPDISNIPDGIINKLKSATHFFSETSIASEIIKSIQTGEYFCSSYQEHLFSQSEPIDDETKIKLIAEWGMDPEHVNYFSKDTPTYVLLMLAGNNRRGLLDIDLDEYAIDHQIPFSPLETQEYREILEARYPEHFSVDIKTIVTHNSLEGVEKLIEQSVRAYFFEKEGGYSKELDSYDDKSVIERNHSWIPILITKLEVGGAFAAFGQYHLYGEHGIINLLRLEGYQVKKCSSPDCY